jgi:hypothetical protein
VNANEVVVHEVDRHAVRVVLSLLGEAVRCRVNRRMPIRIERFCRSAKLGEI